MRRFREQTSSTKTGSPLPNVLKNIHRKFQDPFHEIVEGFVSSKSLGFESLIREGLKETWVSDPFARAHLFYRTVCKLILLAVSADEIQNATPDELVYDYLVRETPPKSSSRTKCTARRKEQDANGGSHGSCLSQTTLSVKCCGITSQRTRLAGLGFSIALRLKTQF